MRVGDSRLQLAEDWSDDDGATFQVTNSFDGEKRSEVATLQVTTSSPPRSDVPVFQVTNTITPPNRLTINQSSSNSLCTTCSISAKMSGRGQRSWGQSGICERGGCPGYKGHPPASRPQG